MTDTPESSACLNCGTPLRGQYCGHCGQRASSRLISLWELIRDAFGDLIELDSRVWQTLGPLLLKPGLLTKDYLIGRRARYMPPFRTYLVLSILFFVVAFFEPSEKFSLLLEPVAIPSPAEIARAEDDGKIPERMLDDFDDSNEVDCEITSDDLQDLPEWLAKRLTVERAQDICTRVSRDRGKYFLSLLRDSMPVALIVLLPLMAMALKVLYPMSRRYFVEHLLFFVHFHAFFFLILTLQVIFQRSMDLLPIPDTIPILVNVAASFYVPVYLYLSMRRLYVQRHLFTVIKYLALLLTYFFGASLTLLGAVFFALLSV